MCTYGLNGLWKGDEQWAPRLRFFGGWPSFTFTADYVNDLTSSWEGYRLLEAARLQPSFLSQWQYSCCCYIRLQSVQNAAAHLVSGTRRHDHITPVLVSLHWLSVRQRIIYKTAVLVWKCLHDAAPRYLVDLCVPAHSVRGGQQLRATASGTLLVPRALTATGQRSFAVNRPRTWNSLPADLRTPDTPSSVISRPTCFSSIVYAADD